MGRERNNRSGGENETSHQIKQLLANSEKLEKKEKTKQKNKTKKQGAAVAFLKGNKKKLQESHTVPYTSGQLIIGFISPCYRELSL